VPGPAAPSEDRIRAAEVIAALSLATDLSLGMEFEHGLRSTLVAMRLCDRLGVDAETASQTYYACLLMYVGCTADAEVAVELFGDHALLREFTPVMFGSQPEMIRGIVRALQSRDRSALVRGAQVARRLPRAVRGHRRHMTAACEVAQMLTERLGLPTAIAGLFVHVDDRWDGQGEAIPLPLRVVHVARDADFQRGLGGDEHAVRTIRARAGRAFDPAIANLLADQAADILTPVAPAWGATLDAEPAPSLMLAGDAIDRALAAIGDFADLASPYLVGHSAGVTELAAAAAARCGVNVRLVRRAALVHDVGRVAVPVRIWQKEAPLTPDDWERVRLHAYHSERVLDRSAFLSTLAPVATAHHERLDGSGYHRGVRAAALTPAARVLAAADAYHAMTEPRPHRPALAAPRVARALGEDVKGGRLDAEAVGAVLEAAGQPSPPLERPAGLTRREAEVVGMLARGFQTKQVARALGISAKTADRHVQNAYAKIGVSTRAAAALFAIEHGLVEWGELPISRSTRRP
jgi:response regulator RpfG family c-di-GMP phosphodiesterase/DNA-binding CsgD family transcriptional regulator